MNRKTFNTVRLYHPWLRLQHCRRLSTLTAVRLVSALGDADTVLAAGTDRLREITENPNVSRRLLNDQDDSGIRRDLAWLGHCDRHHLLAWADGRYPDLLREIPDAPLLLYVSGDPDILSSAQIAIVGSRNPTPGGRDLAARFAGNLAAAGLTITSGLASGVDTAAHRGALSVGRPTVAVMATGPDQVYPRGNRQLAQQIEHSGALVTERPVGSKPLPQAFPRRNRIISGLSTGTLVVEAAHRSGSLITARLAGEQGRDVFAIPGSVHSPLSRGCHTLIRDGAVLVENESDILAELRMPTTRPDETPAVRVGDDDGSVVIAALGYDAEPVDVLVQRSGLTADKVCSILLRLEMQGLVKAVAGGRYMRVPHAAPVNVR